MRLYPFGGGFFLGSGIGYETVRGSFVDKVDIPEVPGVIAAQTAEIRSEATVRSLILTPQLGYFATWGSGFSLGIDVGAQVPIAPSQISFTTKLPDGVPPEYSARGTVEVKNTLEKIGQQVIPTLNLRMGWLL